MVSRIIRNFFGREKEAPAIFMNCKVTPRVFLHATVHHLGFGVRLQMQTGRNCYIFLNYRINFAPMPKSEYKVSSKYN